MDEHTLRLLEFGRVVAEVQDYCFSVEGAEVVAAQRVTTDRGETAERLGLASAFRVLVEQAPLPAMDFPEVAPCVARLSKSGATLAPEELAAVGRAIVSATALKRHVARACGAALAGGRRAGPAGGTGLPSAAEAGFAALSRIAGEVPELDELARMVFRIVDRDGQVKEKEIPELRAIAGRIQALRGDVTRLASAWLADPERRPWWQSDRPSSKDGRTVLAIKANYRGRVPGIVHESSASGATVFVEPADIVEKNNEIALRRGEYDRELLRILREVCAKLALREAELRRLLQRVSELDALHARARYAIGHQCAAALPSDSCGELELVEARHPLLGARAIPIEIRLPAGVRTLIITGPNTGGKTVSLKTVGLLAAMNQFGLEIPAAAGSRLPVFDEILADIGDEQSIEQSLSTFSGHVRNLARIVGSASPRSLVLLDELGAGTDPEEGVAIAMAVLDHFIDRQAVTLVTTHHGILKNYGYTRAGVMNASMEFDTRTLSPTFRIRLGVPGESHALDIARGHGMSSDLIDRARAYLNDERSDISRVIERLAAKERELAAAERTAQQRESELREQRRATDLRELRLRQRERELRQAGIADLRRFLDDGRRRLDGLIQQIQESKEGAALGRDLTRQAAEFVRELRDRVDAEERRVEQEEGSEPPDQGDLELAPGMEVVVRATGRRGRLLRRARGGLWVVETDTVRATLPAAHLRLSAASEDIGRVEVVSSLNETPRAVLELDLRGLRLEEALAALQKQLDAALLQGMHEFGVIHGKGEGVLREAVHRALRAEPSVREFSFSRPELGGFGRTEVRLK